MSVSYSLSLLFTSVKRRLNKYLFFFHIQPVWLACFSSTKYSGYILTIEQQTVFITQAR